MGQKGQAVYHQRVLPYLIQIQAPYFFQGPLIKFGQKLEDQFSSLGKMKGPYLGHRTFPRRGPSSFSMLEKMTF